MDASFLARFHAKVDRRGPDDCWPWTASRYKFGYGQILGPGRIPLRAHRVAYEIANGPIPKGRMVLHQCGNAACCNPAHLYLGGQAQNMRDRSRHGHAVTKLTEEQVRWIRLEFASIAEAAIKAKDWRAARRYGWVAAKARELGVQRSVIQDILDGLSWRHLDPENPPAQLNRDSVVAIRRDYSAGASTKTLAMEYGVTPQCIRDIVARRTWAKVP